jgi:hypothetical protein
LQTGSDLGIARKPVPMRRRHWVLPQVSSATLTGITMQFGFSPA